MKLLLTFVFSLFYLISAGQCCEKTLDNYWTPRNLDRCFVLLNKTMNEEELNVVKNYHEDSILKSNEFQYSAYFFHAWNIYDGSKITRYFNKKGLYGAHPIHNVILISFHRHLNNLPIKLNEQIAYYQQEQEKINQRFEKRIKQKIINGKYIPKNLDECFETLDTILKQEDIQKIKLFDSREETISLHHGLGMWIRNNWGLWGGSRLQVYFTRLEVKHPDEMSSLILACYHDYLNSNPILWENYNSENN